MPELILSTVITVNGREKANSIAHYLHKNYKIISNNKIVGPNIYEVYCQCENKKQIEHLKEIAKAVLYGLNLGKE